jgi:hypothetical protein
LLNCYIKLMKCYVVFVLRSQSVRSYWGVLMRSGAARRDYAELQIHNVVTLATRVRITLLRVTFKFTYSNCGLAHIFAHWLSTICLSYLIFFKFY